MSEQMEDLSVEIIDREGFSKFAVEISTGLIEIKVVQNVDVSGLHSQARSWEEWVYFPCLIFGTSLFTLHPTARRGIVPASDSIVKQTVNIFSTNYIL